ncbi:non-specific serine/threonine protein kinase [Pseudoscourfieldia marina]
MATAPMAEDAESRLSRVLPSLLDYALGSAADSAAAAAAAAASASTSASTSAHSQPSYGLRLSETRTALHLLRLAAQQTELLTGPPGGALSLTRLMPRLMPQLAAEPAHAILAPHLALALAAAVPAVAARGGTQALQAMYEGARDALEDAVALAEYFAFATECAPSGGWVPADVAVDLFPARAVHATDKFAEHLDSSVTVSVRCANGALQLGSVAACVLGACISNAAPLILASGGASCARSLLALALAEAARQGAPDLARVACLGTLVQLMQQRLHLPGVASEALELAISEASRAASATPALLRATAAVVRAAVASLASTDRRRLTAVLARSAEPLGRALAACAAASHAAPEDALRLLGALAAAHATACTCVREAVADAAVSFVDAAVHAAASATPGCRDTLADAVGAAAITAASLASQTRSADGQPPESPARKRRRQETSAPKNSRNLELSVTASGEDMHASKSQGVEKALVTHAKEASALPPPSASSAEVAARLNQLVLVARAVAPMRHRAAHVAVRDATAAWLNACGSWTGMHSSPLLQDPAVSEAVMAIVAEAARWRAPGAPACLSRGAESVDLFPPSWHNAETLLGYPFTTSTTAEMATNAKTIFASAKMLALEAGMSLACFARRRDQFSKLAPKCAANAALADSEPAIRAAALGALPYITSDRRAIADAANQAGDLQCAAHAKLGMLQTDSSHVNLTYPLGFARAVVTLAASRSAGTDVSTTCVFDGRLYEPTLWAITSDPEERPIHQVMGQKLTNCLPMTESVLTASGAVREEVVALLQNIVATFHEQADSTLRAAALRLLRRCLCAAMAIRDLDAAMSHTESISRSPLPLKPDGWHVRVISACFSSRSSALAYSAVGFTAALIASDAVSEADTASEYAMLKCVNDILDDELPHHATGAAPMSQASQGATAAARTITDTALCLVSILSHRVRVTKMSNALVVLVRRLDDARSASRRCLVGVLLRRMANRLHPTGGGTRKLLVETPILLEYLARSVLQSPALAAECADVLLGGADQKELLAIALPVSLPKLLEYERPGFDPRELVTEIARRLGRDPKDCLLQYGPMALARCYANSNRHTNHATKVTVERVEAITGMGLTKFLRESVQEIVHGIIWFGCADRGEDLRESSSHVKLMLSDVAGEIEVAGQSDPTELLAAHFVSLSTFLHQVLSGEGLHGDASGLVAAGRAPLASDPNEADGSRAVRCLDLVARLANERVADFAPQLIANLTRATNTKKLRSLALVAWHTFVSALGNCSKEALARHAPQVAVALAPSLEHGTEQECDNAASVLDAIASFATDAGVADAIRKWPTLPNRHQVFDFSAVADQLRGDVTPGRRMRMLLENVLHSNVSVRYTALTELLHTLREHGSKLPMEDVSLTKDDFPSASEVMGTLLLCCSEGEVRTSLSEPLKMRLAECLGELGAVDPSRCEVKPQKSERLPKNGRELRSVIVKEHLSRLYKSANDLETLNAATLGVQEILRQCTVEEEVHSTEETELWKNLDPELKSLLQPCLRSALQLQENASGAMPVAMTTDQGEISVSAIWESMLDSGMSFRRWLHLWLRRLVASLPTDTSRLGEYARAVAGVLKASSSAMRFDMPLMLRLLPVACHAAVCYGGDAGAALVRCEVLAVLAAATKLRGRSGRSDGDGTDSAEVVAEGVNGTLPSSTNHSTTRTGGGVGLANVELAAQAIFQMLDTITQWHQPKPSEAIYRMHEEEMRHRQGKSESAASKRARAERKRVGDEFVDKVSLYLLAEAAVAVRAYARAIRYLHSHLRELHRDGVGGCLNPAHLLPDAIKTDTGVGGAGGTQGIGGNVVPSRSTSSSAAQPPAKIGFGTAADGALDLLREAHAGLADADSLLCLPSLRGREAFDDAVVIAEAEGRWGDALSLREQALQHASISRATTSSAEKKADESSRFHDLRQGQLKSLLHMGHLHSVVVHADAALTTHHSRGACASESRDPALAACTAHGVGAAWRLGQWDDLDRYLDVLDAPSRNSPASVEVNGVEAVSNVCVGKLLHELRHGSKERLSAAACEARQRLMESLPAAAMESYARAYPTLVSLQCVREVEECGLAFLGNGKASSDGQVVHDVGAVRTLVDGVPWSSRLSRCRTSLDAREPVLAARRQALAICGGAEDAGRLGRMWLSLAELARREGHVDAAESAVAEAISLKDPTAPMERAKLLWSRGLLHKAMHEIRAVCGVSALATPAAAAAAAAPSQRRRGSTPSPSTSSSLLSSEAEAKAYLRLARWAHRTGQESKESLVSLYETACKGLSGRESGHFHLAEYHSELLEHMRKVRNAARGASSSSASRSTKSADRERAKRLSDDAQFYPIMVSCLRNYVRSMSHGHKHILRSLPRMLTLWFDLGDEVVDSRRANEYQSGSSLAHSWNEALGIARSWVDRAASDGALPSYAWLIVLSQLTGRLCHRNVDVRGVIRKVLATTLTHYPRQVVWRLVAAERSANEERAKEAREVRSLAERMQMSNGLVSLLRAFPKFIDTLQRLSYHKGDEAKKGTRTQPQFSIQRFLPQLHQTLPVNCVVPTEVQLNATLPSNNLVNAKWDPFGGGVVTIESIVDKVDVMKSLQKPKKVDFIGSDGSNYTMLCKPGDDLRKDGRMMEFNHALNALLSKAHRKSAPRVRTFAVVPLGEEWGVVEWVHNTRPLRFVLEDNYRVRGMWNDTNAPENTVRRIRQWYEAFPGYAQKPQAVRDPAALLRGVLKMFPPVLHSWFLSTYVEPSVWYLHKSNFTRSCAVWSMVGYVVGLGDRHGENILLDAATGSVLHIDFSCLFDRGLNLECPEVVPFRLTHNVVDGFGVEGVDGMYRKACCSVLAVLREERNTLESVLEAFVHDPLFEWARDGSAAAAARDALSRIKERLSGIVVTAVERLQRGGHAPSLPMSVDGQVRKLIADATNHELLGRMYIWWMPFW